MTSNPSFIIFRGETFATVAATAAAAAAAAATALLRLLSVWMESETMGTHYDGDGQTRTKTWSYRHESLIHSDIFSLLVWIPVCLFFAASFELSFSLISHSWLQLHFLGLLLPCLFKPALPPGCTSKVCFSIAKCANTEQLWKELGLNLGPHSQ